MIKIVSNSNEKVAFQHAKMINGLSDANLCLYRVFLHIIQTCSICLFDLML